MNIAFKGSLKDVNVPDMIKVLTFAGKTGRLTLKKGDRYGHIYFSSGEVVSSKLGTLDGEDALYQLAIWNQGEFFLEPDINPEKRSITKSNNTLIVEAAKRLKEWKQISSKIPSIFYIPEFIPQNKSEAPQISLTTNEWILLSKVDGKRNIKEISDAANFNIFETCKIFYGLLTSGLLQLKKQVFENAKVEEEKEKKVKEVSIEKIINELQLIAEEFLGNLADGILDKPFKKARINVKSISFIKQSQNFYVAITLLQRDTSNVIGKDASYRMAGKMRKVVDKYAK